MAGHFVNYPGPGEYRVYFASQDVFSQRGRGPRTYFRGLPVDQYHQQFGTGFFTDLFRGSLVPLLRSIPAFFKSSAGKKLVRNVAQHGVKAAANVASDIIGRDEEPRVPVKQAAKRRLDEFGKDVFGEVKKTAMGGGRRRRRRRRPAQKGKGTTRQRRRGQRRKPLKGRQRGGRALVWRKKARRTVRKKRKGVGRKRVIDFLSKP